MIFTLGLILLVAGTLLHPVVTIWQVLERLPKAAQTRAAVAHCLQLAGWGCMALSILILLWRHMP